MGLGFERLLKKEEVGTNQLPRGMQVKSRETPCMCVVGAPPSTCVWLERRRIYRYILVGCDGHTVIMHVLSGKTVE
jgi:hypothetical protein